MKKLKIKDVTKIDVTQYTPLWIYMHDRTYYHVRMKVYDEVWLPSSNQIKDPMIIQIFDNFLN
jgi:hypothetical protein